MFRRPKWILIVQECEDSAGALKAQLQDAGYRVLVAGDCSKAHRMMQNQKFSCVIIDHVVRGVCGASVIRAIKKNQHHVNFTSPFLLISEFLELSDLRQIAKNIEGAFIRPFNDNELVAKVKSITPPTVEI